MKIRKAKLKDIKRVTEYGVSLLKQHYDFDSYFAPAKNVHEVYQKFLLKKWFKNKNLKHIELTVHVENEIGKKAWAKYGFEDYIIKRKVGMGRFNIT